MYLYIYLPIFIYFDISWHVSNNRESVLIDKRFDWTPNTKLHNVYMMIQDN